MPNLKLPVRWYGDKPQRGDLELELKRTAFMVVDSDGGKEDVYVTEGIAPALEAARNVGMKVIFIHNDFSLVDEPGSIKREMHFERWGRPKSTSRARSPKKPVYAPCIQPLPDEPDFPKNEYSGFHDTHVDYHLRCYDIKTLIAVGFSQRACLYQTVVGALEHNYRPIILREGTFSAEYPDTEDDNLPEKGWVRKIMFRNFEHIIGYTASTADFVSSCNAIRQS